MQSSAEAVYSASSPPFILDSDMSGQLDSDPDFEFFDSSNVPLEAANSPGIFFAHDLTADSSQLLDADSPAASTYKTPIQEQSPLLESTLHHPFSAPSTASPAGSSPDFGSDSSEYKRKSSSESSRSGLTAGDVMMADDEDMEVWKTEGVLVGKHGTDFGAFDGTINPASMSNNFEFNDKSMENDFDFESAASSPSPIGSGPVDTESLKMPNIKYEQQYKRSPKLSRNHNKAYSQHSVTQSMKGLTASTSREASPLSAMITSQESSPSGYFNKSPSPSTGVEFVNGKMLGALPSTSAWPTDFSKFSNHGLPASHQNLNHYPVSRMAQPQGIPPIGSPYKPILTIHPTPLKSRVETQIPIKMTLFPVPAGINKLHLPTHTISKPKLLAKPTPERSPGTLELYTTLVCTSAMQNPENRRRAFERAAAAPLHRKEEPSEVGLEDEREEDKPLNGGDVEICPGCITRERKRAARKKIKKVEEEELWHRHEAKRVIVFNTHEIKDWQAPTSQPLSESTGDRAEPFVPEGAMQVDAPMRIACYCRHQNEKLGFQVIFTIKDYQDRLIAQEISSSIMITDDHKTHNLPASTAQTANGPDGQIFPEARSFPIDGRFDPNSGPPGDVGPFHLSQSSSDLQKLRGNPNLQFSTSGNLNTPSHNSSATSTTITPHNLSHQTSPSASSGPISKKRKASGSGSLPPGLAMTRLETGTVSPGQAGSTSMNPTATTLPSPFTPNPASFPQPETMPYNAHPFGAGPPTPNSNDHVFFSNNNRSQSMENLAMAQTMYSAPVSAHPSRAASPTGMRNGVPAYQHQQQQAQIAQAVANGLYGIPLSLNPHHPPTIHKLIPNEGPKSGGIEVTCLGSGFCQGLEVMFGDSKATTTTYWGETSLVCLLPPSAFAGAVPVTFRHQHQQHMQPYPTSLAPKQQASFKYVDDDEQQIIRTALAVLGHKMTGKMEDVRDLAKRIVGDGSSSWGAPTGSSSGGAGNQQVSGFNAAAFGVDVEATLLRCLDLIDLDDSPNMPRLNLRRASGQTMLHLACSLGLTRFVAGLLARGANPEPRDKGGFTPMHFAALHNHPQIVRRLMLSGADPRTRSLQGYTSADMATSEEVIRMTRRVEHHSRTRSGTSLKTRTSSATSLRSVWEPASVTTSVAQDSSDDGDAAEDEYEDEDADAANDEAFYMRLGRPSTQKVKVEGADTTAAVLNLPAVGPAAGLASPTAAMAAFRDQLTAQIQHLHQTMHLNLPNLPQMPNLPDYQAYLNPLQATPMVRRISNLVGNNRQDGSKEQDYKWWDLFSGMVPAAPPAYEDIFPQDVDTKRESATRAAADAVADNKCVEVFDQAESSTSAAKKKSVVLNTVRIGNQHTITREQQDLLRMAHAEKVKRLSRDRNLFFIWIPLLVVIIVAMLCNRVPQVWSRAANFFDSMRAWNGGQERIVEVL